MITTLIFTAYSFRDSSTHRFPSITCSYCTDNRYRYSTAIRSYINDDESTVLGTDVPFAGSRDTVGKKGSSRE